VDSKNVEAFFGLARLGERVRKVNISQNAVNDILYQNPDYLPGLIEKCRLGVFKRDSGMTKEGYQDVLKIDRNNILGYVYWTFSLLAYEGALDEAREKYEKLYQLIANQEPDNAELMMFVAKLMSRICGRATVIVNISIKLIERVRQLDMESIDAMLEMALNLYMIEDYQQALNMYKMASSLNPDASDIRPMIGILRTQIAKGDIGEAELQLKFLKEMVDGESSKTPELKLVEGMLYGRKKVDKKDMEAFESVLQESNKVLDECIKLHVAQQKKVSQNLDYFIVLNPDLLLSLSNEMLHHSDFNLTQIKEQIQNPITPTHLIKKAVKLLETTMVKIPGLIPGYMLAAKANLIVGNVNAAIQTLQKALALDPKNEEAYILNAIVVYSNGNPEAAYNSIKEALANNFDMDKNAFFMMLKGQLEIELGETQAGLKTLEKAFNLPGIQSGNFEQKKKARYMTMISFNQNIRSQIYVEYAKALAADKQLNKSKEIMEQAIMEFVGTDDEPVVLLGNADIAVITGDLKKALTILRGVEPTAKGYMEARKKLALIYKDKMMNRRQYAKCFFDLVQAIPNFENYKKYGDALLDIQEPDKAIEAYNEALKIDPNNQNIVRLIGKALSITHSYQKAFTYYSDATARFPKNLDLKLDHAKLLVKNNFLDKAEELLNKEALLQETEEKSMETIFRSIESLLELCKIFRVRIEAEGSFDPERVGQIHEIWKRILGLQLDLIERSKYEGGKPDQEKIKYAEYCESAASFCVETEVKLDKAKEYFEEAYKYNPNKIELLLDLAEVDFYNGEVEEATQKCSKVLKSNPNNPWALRLLADCILTQGELEKGITGFERVYARDPTNFIALGCLFDFYRRNGQMEKIKEILDHMEQKMGRSNEPGYCYVRGLYYYYRKNPSEALVHLYIAKRHPLYKNPSIKIMIDIYLNPDQDLLFTTTPEKIKPFKAENLQSMELLLNELSDKYFSIEHEIYAYYGPILLKKEFDDAEAFLTQTLKEKPSLIPAMLCLCVCRMARGGKNSLDKNLLRDISKSKFNAKWGDETERGWIQVAEFLMGANKPDLAEKELRRCLKYNQSCAKAYELLGSLSEKKNDFQEAVSYYNKAWEVSEFRDCSIGFRLASLYFKYKDYMNAIIIGKKVLNLNSAYPKIKEEIIDKARELVKP